MCTFHQNAALFRSTTPRSAGATNLLVLLIQVAGSMLLLVLRATGASVKQNRSETHAISLTRIGMQTKFKAGR